MKNTIKALLAVSVLSFGSSAFAATSLFNCDYPLFHAQTEKGNKEVKLCIQGDYVVYTFGKRDTDKTEMDTIAEKSAVSVYNYRYGSEINFPNGEYLYTVSDMVSEDGIANKVLSVHKGNKKLATIPLGKVLINNLSEDLGSYGIEVE